MTGALVGTSSALGSDQPTSACKRVLIAEDDPMQRTILRSWLESWGYEVVLAEDGAKAWDILQRNTAPQLMILDWMMPAKDGLEICSLVRERDQIPYQYILLVTAKDQKQDAVQALEAGADDYLSKPFDRNELRARLRTGRRILTLQDEQIKATEALHFQATHDGLTGIWNRTAIMDLLCREFEASARAATLTGIMMLDVDHFKRVNDSHGHQAGDAVLREVTQRVQQSVRADDLVGRYGGEEFLIVLPDCEGGQLQACAERIRRSIASDAVSVHGVAIPVTVSIGTAILDPLSTSEKEALAAADTALYHAKNSGRNRVVSLDLRFA